MNIWVDFINTPQVSFWFPFIKEFINENHTVILTCRDSGNTLDLLNEYKLNYTVIGQRAARGKFQKLILFFKRLVLVFLYIHKIKPDIAVSQSSFYQPIVARLLHIPCLYTNDNEHAKGNIFGFLFANTVILPEALCNENFTKNRFIRAKLSFYPSVKEAIYLSQQPELYDLISDKKSVIYFRPEPWSAEYYNGPVNFFDNVLVTIANNYKVTVLPRDKYQSDYYKQPKFNKISVAEKPLKLKDIISDCLLFIGAGGSMTRELAVLGVSVISIYQDEMLCVDKYLVEKGKMIIKPDITYHQLINILSSITMNEIDSDVLNEGKESHKLIKKLVYALA